MQKLSDLIYEKRKAAGLTQEKLAELSNVNRITIRRYENEDFKNLDFKQLFDISKALNFNLIAYLSVYFEGMSMEEYSKLFLLNNMIINVQKSETEKFITENKDDDCFKTSIGRELYFYAKALVEFEKKEYRIALHNLYTGLGLDISLYDVKDINSKSVIFLKLMMLSGTCLLGIGKFERSEQIYYQLYNFMSSMDYKERIFKDQLFHTDFNDLQNMILCNLAHLYIFYTKDYDKAVEVCDKAIKLMFENKTFKFYYPIVVNKALAEYNLNKFSEAKRTLIRIYHYLNSINEIDQIEIFNKLIVDNFPKISDVISYMTEPDFNN